MYLQDLLGITVGTCIKNIWSFLQYAHISSMVKSILPLTLGELLLK
jgi:uncharacterized membrane protein